MAQDAAGPGSGSEVVHDGPLRRRRKRTGMEASRTEKMKKGMVSTRCPKCNQKIKVDEFYEHGIREMTYREKKNGKS